LASRLTGSGFTDKFMLNLLGIKELELAEFGKDDNFGTKCWP
jgi:hypothetical protein